MEINKLEMTLREKLLFNLLEKKDYTYNEIKEALTNFDRDICSTEFYLLLGHLASLNKWKYIDWSLKKRISHIQEYFQLHYLLTKKETLKIINDLNSLGVVPLIISSFADRLFFLKKQICTIYNASILVKKEDFDQAFNYFHKKYNIVSYSQTEIIFQVNNIKVGLNYSFLPYEYSSITSLFERGKEIQDKYAHFFLLSLEDHIIKECIDEYYNIFVLNKDNRELRFITHFRKLMKRANKEKLFALLQKEDKKINEAFNTMYESYLLAINKKSEEEKQIVIEKIYFQNFRNNFVVCYDVNIMNKPFSFYLRIKEKYKKYLEINNGDFMILSLLPLAVKKELTLISKVPISTNLAKAIKASILPNLNIRYNKKNVIKLDYEVIENTMINETRGAVLLLNDINSLYTYTKLKNKDLRFFYLNIGQSLQKANYPNTITLNSNLYLLNSFENYLEVDYFRLAACSYALNNYFNEFIIPSVKLPEIIRYEHQELGYFHLPLMNYLSSDKINFTLFDVSIGLSKKIDYLLKKNIFWDFYFDENHHYINYLGDYHEEIVILYILGYQNIIEELYKQKINKTYFQIHLGIVLALKRNIDVAHLLKEYNIEITPFCLKIRNEIKLVLNNLLKDSSSPLKADITSCEF